MQATELKAFIVCVLLLSVSSLQASEQVPFGSVVSKNIVNYHRHTPQIATSGKLLPGAMSELKAHGFKTILDIRTIKEGTAAEAQTAGEEGIIYHNLPVDKPWPEASVFKRFKALVEDKNNYPLLIHCGSANRVGMMWSVYQLENGIEYDQAILEGRTIGMRPKREKQIDTNFGVK